MRNTEWMDRALSTVEHSVPLLKALGEHHLKVGNFEKALAHFLGCLEIAPPSPEIYYKVVFALEGQGRYQEAMDLLGDNLREVQDFSNSVIWLRIHLKTGNFDYAEKLYRSSCKIKKELLSTLDEDRKARYSENWRRMDLEWANCMAGNVSIDGTSRPPTPLRLLNSESAIELLQPIFDDSPDEIKRPAAKILINALEAVGRSEDAARYRSYADRL